MQYHFALAALAAVQAVSALPYPTGAFDWSSETVRGISLGGWLVLEPWITPSIFEAAGPPSNGIVDEYTLGEKLGHDAAYAVLKSHWDTWITEKDIEQISAWGFNTIRIPIGFWAFQTFGTPYVQGAEVYLDNAIGWARTHKVNVLIDLHGAPLSQNGFDNSGQKMAKPMWQTGDSVAQTLQVLQQINDKYATANYNDVVMGIELLNEPLSPELNLDQLKDFYRQGYAGVRKDSSTMTVVLQDAFQPPSSYNGFLTPSDNNAQHVALDHHEYQVFSDGDVALQPWQHRQLVCNNANSYSGADKWTIVGEWTGAMTDCAVALNGYGVGARYDGTYPGSSKVGSCATINDISTWSPTLINDTRGYIEAQMETFESVGKGWIFWTYKTEGSAEWDVGRLISVGAFPQPLSNRKFSAICSS